MVFKDNEQYINREITIHHKELCNIHNPSTHSILPHYFGKYIVSKKWPTLLWR